MGDMKNAYEILVGVPQAKKPLRRPRRRWEDNIRMHIKEIEWEGVDYMHLAQDKEVVSSFEHGNELSGSIKVKVNLSLCLTKHSAMKTYLLLN
jgi:hypothetical protein